MAFGQEILIALGANLPSEEGTPHETLKAALTSLAREGFAIADVSDFYATPCFPAGFGPDYCNACARLTGPADPHEILAALHRVETQFGRARARRWGSRTLDLDLLAVGETVMPDEATQTLWREISAEQQRENTPERLILPHPRIQDRAFVLVPLCDIAADWRHPILGSTARELCDALPAEARAEVVRM
ncbi:2-amino-4-hydroxy-6-hydroxymethyldihydropteridine diphosphokinase [Salipiger mangrovisoli]|uniref:2-amino-4-hydroxy-6-hydroxymethyldihydropteridine pyrophosphokinase n=1 Tax=Salipiger mangrovisoli TaxID=2865933 RepID=A0ABR9X2G3_9RHOB|nr:2-amino-4-hydroxy-6-hydroxymethyldihydropteridine diphosphokinase [Salipiger mangrovisoli]MBE9637655.1 2-amino-4-hydroxy-6-hydroxymethyldihydropteridine diphosphokinase [Salipiger mangrovisoli]